MRVTDSAGRTDTSTAKVVVRQNLVGSAGFESGLLRWNTSGSGLGVRADVSGARLRLRFREWGGSALLGAASSEVTLTPFWQQVVVRYTALAPGLSTVDFNAQVSGARPGSCFYADDAAITAG